MSRNMTTAEMRSWAKQNFYTGTWESLRKIPRDQLEDMIVQFRHKGKRRSRSPSRQYTIQTLITDLPKFPYYPMSLRERSPSPPKRYIQKSMKEYMKKLPKRSRSRSPIKMSIDLDAPIDSRLGTPVYNWDFDVSDPKYSALFDIDKPIME